MIIDITIYYILGIWKRSSLRFLIQTAFSVRSYQFVGDWLRSTSCIGS